ncbi:hypothetical protein PFX98_23180 [Paucibacter sediminis]|jgi:hypothetical protein|uniref:Uncharacterized protein n=1 Tax=Paucibacter sediminis TaxID=3019553 RepID=A0AA95SL30_9BURK|nr:hypothetical protein [Paucibacter sp. S2-9]WIT11753.1 hypothetical protein PFX98_23180 [Paucibacter sp. S2-9]
MKLKQLGQVKRWMIGHAHQHPVELAVWNLVLTCWVMGWMGMPSAMLIEEWAALPACLTATLVPSLYASARLRLHRHGRLRCDWLTAL